MSPNEAEMAARQIISQAKNCFAIMTKSFNDGAKLFWDNPRGVPPEDIAAALGNNAKEVFELHYALGQFVSNIKPDSIIPGLSLIGQFTMNEDGTVTVIKPDPEPPSPAPNTISE